MAPQPLRPVPADSVGVMGTSSQFVGASPLLEEGTVLWHSVVLADATVMEWLGLNRRRRQGVEDVAIPCIHLPIRSPVGAEGTVQRLAPALSLL